MVTLLLSCFWSCVRYLVVDVDMFLPILWKNMKHRSVMLKDKLESQINAISNIWRFWSRFQKCNLLKCSKLTFSLGFKWETTRITHKRRVPNLPYKWTKQAPKRPFVRQSSVQMDTPRADSKKENLNRPVLNLPLAFVKIFLHAVKELCETF